MSLFLFLLPLPIYYLFGTFPSGILVAKIKGINIQTTGSGNVGATNVARSVGKKAGALTLLFDISKAMLSLLIADLIGRGSLSYIAFAGLITVVGHCFSIPGLLKGGKGVATALGVLFYVNWILALIALLGFALVFFYSRIVSLSSLAATALASLSAILMNLPGNTWISIGLIAWLITYRHKENLERLAQGSEKKFNFGNTA